MRKIKEIKYSCLLPGNDGELRHEAGSLDGSPEIRGWPVAQEVPCGKSGCSVLEERVSLSLSHRGDSQANPTALPRPRPAARLRLQTPLKRPLLSHPGRFSESDSPVHCASESLLRFVLTTLSPLPHNQGRGLTRSR